MALGDQEAGSGVTLARPGFTPRAEQKVALSTDVAIRSASWRAERYSELFQLVDAANTSARGFGPTRQF
jgi:hypothetical protein